MPTLYQQQATTTTHSHEIVLNAIKAYAVALAEMDDCPSEETCSTRDDCWDALIALGIGTREGAFTLLHPAQSAQPRLLCTATLAAPAKKPRWKTGPLVT